MNSEDEKDNLDSKEIGLTRNLKTLFSAAVWGGTNFMFTNSPTLAIISAGLGAALHRIASMDCGCFDEEETSNKGGDETRMSGNVSISQYHRARSLGIKGF
jgi:hypothetical protein